MIRLTDPTRLGPALAEIRDMHGTSRREVARGVAQATGLPQNTIESQLWRWERGRVSGPDLRAIAPVLDALGYDLALVPREDAR